MRIPNAKRLKKIGAFQLFRLVRDFSMKPGAGIGPVAVGRGGGKFEGGGGLIEGHELALLFWTGSLCAQSAECKIAETALILSKKGICVEYSHFQVEERTGSYSLSSMSRNRSAFVRHPRRLPLP